MTKVEKLLANYQEMKRTLDLLAFRINYFSGLSEDHIIEDLTFTTPEGERVTTSGVSDKTSRIAFAYQNTSYEQSKEILQELVRRYRALRSDLDLLEFCITLLEEELSEIITDLVINGMEWEEVCSKYNISRTTLGRFRQRAEEKIAGMFEAVIGLTG
jgi:predicted DNA-binding protein (UPF0251 family)